MTEQLALLGTEQLPPQRVRFGCVYADPPWPEYGGGRRGAQNHYPLMTVEQIAALPVWRIVKPTAHLWMWVTNTYLFEAKAVLDAWGFRYVTNRCWDKGVRGLGQYVRQEHELLLLAVRGDAAVPPPEARPGSMIRERRTVHSRKPLLYEAIEAASPGPRVELFARSGRSGWTSLGNQAPGTAGADINDELWRLVDGRPASLGL